MADEPEKHRTPAPQPLPNDEEFTPGRDPGPDAHPPEDEFWDNIMFETNDYKQEHYRASAQQMANDWGCAVLLHFYALPHYQHNNGTMMAAIIPADEGKAVAPTPPARAVPPTTQSKNNARR
jgi:hypothetical protein